MAFSLSLAVPSRLRAFTVQPGLARRSQSVLVLVSVAKATA